MSEDKKDVVGGVWGHTGEKLCS